MLQDGYDNVLPRASGRAIVCDFIPGDRFHPSLLVKCLFSFIQGQVQGTHLDQFLILHKFGRRN